MIGKKPYLLRALYEWIIDNGWTPHLVVDINTNELSVPDGYAKDGYIVLNVSVGAVQALELGNEIVSFSARFGGKASAIWFPIESVAGIYARENNEGLQFVVSKVEQNVDVTDDDDTKAKPSIGLASVSDDSAPQSSDDDKLDIPKTRSKPKLTVVSNRETDDDNQ